MNAGAEEWKTMSRKKAAASVAKAAAAAVAKSEDKAEEKEEAEGDVEQARQRRTFLEVVLGGVKAGGSSKPAVKAGPRGVEEASSKVEAIKAAIASLGLGEAVGDYRA